MNIFFIGMGNMGQHRLKSVEKLYKKFNLNVVGFYDPNVSSIFFREKEIHSLNNINELNYDFVKLNKIDLFIIGIPHSLIYPTLKSLLQTKLPLTFLVEKPLGINIEEAKKIKNLMLSNQKIFVGLNYRYYNGISTLLKDFQEKKFGEINSLSISMGHGQGSKFVNSWKINKKFAGGGVVIDPGIHIINLTQLLAGNDVSLVAKHLTFNNFWNTGIEEQCNLLFSSKSIPLINLNVSILKWRSNFDLSLFGNDCYGIVNGRGTHYGNQIYRFGRRWAWENSHLDNQIDTELVKSQSDEHEVFTIELENI